MTVIDRFQYEDGSHMPLSNFYPSPIDFNGAIFPTVEHYFQAMKTDDLSQREAVRACATPGDAKRAGRQVTLKPGWDERRIAVMRYGLELKFGPQHQVLADWLLSTGDTLLVEGNTWGDTFWGRVRGVGSNWLGHLLMARRAELRSGETR